MELRKLEMAGYTFTETLKGSYHLVVPNDFTKKNINDATNKIITLRNRLRKIGSVEKLVLEVKGQGYFLIGGFHGKNYYNPEVIKAILRRV